MKYVLIALLTLFSLSSCRNDSTRFIEEHPLVAEQTIEKFTITETKAGKIKMAVEAEHAVIKDAQKKAYVKLPRIKFYKDGKYASILIGEKAIINMENYDVQGVGKCTVESADGEYLEAYNVFYNSALQKVTSKEKVKITRKDEIITGTGFEADAALENIIIKKQKIVLENVNEKMPD
jgi:LPS export ABC transporter protein LptC